MLRFKWTLTWGLFAVLLASVVGACSEAPVTTAPARQPSPDLSPADVVVAQIAAIMNNNEPTQDAGITTAFGFASPKNQELTGPLDHFIEIVHGGYQPMLKAVSYEIGTVMVKDQAAQVPVAIATSDGRMAVYVFLLSKQTDEPFVDCWMTEGVTEIDLSDGEDSIARYQEI